MCRAFTFAELGVGLGSLHGEKFTVGEIHRTLTLGSVDPQCGSEEVNSMPDLSWEVVREETSWNLENTHFKNCFKVSKYSVCTVCSSLAGLKAIHF